MTLNRHRVDFCKIIESPNSFGLTKTKLKLAIGYKPTLAIGYTPTLAIGYKPTKTPLSLLLAQCVPDGQNYVGPLLACDVMPASVTTLGQPLSAIWVGIHSFQSRDYYR